MKILTKLLSGFIAVAVLCGVVGVVGVMQVSNLGNTLAEMSNVTLPTLDYLNAVDTELTNVKVGIRTISHPEVLNDKITYDRQIANIEKARSAYKEALAKYEELPTVPEEQKIYDELKPMFITAGAYNDQILELVIQSKDATGEELQLLQAEIYDLISSDKRIVFDDMQTQLRKLVAFDRQYYGVELPKKATEAADAGRLVLVLVTILTFIVALILGLFLGISISKPLKKSVIILDKVATGDLSEKMEVNTKDEFKQVAASLNTVIANVSALASEADMLTTAAVEGRLATRGDPEKFKGDYRKIVDGVNKTLDAVIGPLNVAANYVDRISKGDLPEKITDSYNGDFNKIKDNLNIAIDSIKALVDDANMLTEAAVAGALQTRADGSKHKGDYRKIVDGVNKTLDAVIGPLNVAANYVDRISKGDLPEKITDSYNGDFNKIKDNLNIAIDSIKALVDDANMLTEAAVAGALQTRADGSRHKGDYRKIVDGVNKTLDLVITPINETIAVLKRLAEGDLTQRMTGDYKGDFDILKTGLNDSLNSINDTLGQINTAVEQVAEGSLQVSQASQALSQGATEQASSLEEITSSTTEISSQTRTNTESALKVNGLAKGAQENAEKGNNQMKELVSAMSDINTSAEEIKKVVKTIDDIAFQINLLALNANVEAARAGKYGKGFAVVAEEVRNLAVRSANSVKDTTRMVDEAISNIQRGNVLVDGTAKQLDDIVNGAAQVAGLAEEVAVASREQTQGLEQISLGLNQIDQVTQSNTASAEQSASASEELSSQAQQVKSMLSRFKLKVTEAKLNNAEVMAMLRAELANRDNVHKHGTGMKSASSKIASAPAGRAKTSAVNPADIISLDDNNFGKF